MGRTCSRCFATWDIGLDLQNVKVQWTKSHSSYFGILGRNPTHLSVSLIAIEQWRQINNNLVTFHDACDLLVETATFHPHLMVGSVHGMNSAHGILSLEKALKQLLLSENSQGRGLAGWRSHTEQTFPLLTDFSPPPPPPRCQQTSSLDLKPLNGKSLPFRKCTLWI